MKIQYILDWKKKVITNNGGFQPLYFRELAELADLALTISCSKEDFVWIKIEKGYSANLAEIVMGKTIIKSLSRGATSENPEGLGSRAVKKMLELCPNFVSEHPSHDKETFLAIGGWQYPPRFETFQEGTFKQVWRLDYKSFYANIMRDYPLPWGEPTHIRNPEQIVEELQNRKTGFVRFYLKHSAKIKNHQIPFIPDFHNEVKSEIKGRLLLYTRLFKIFRRHYKIRGKIIYTDFWMFEEKRGCADPFLDYCQKLRQTKETSQEGKMLVNSLWAALGKNNFRGYNYRAWSVAVRHLAILRLYNLYRLFDPEKIIAIRGDEIYVQGELPAKLNLDLFHCQFINRLTLQRDTIFNHDNQELKAFINNPQEREKLIKHFQDRHV